MKEAGEGYRVQADEGWTKRGNRGTTASPQTDYHPNSVPPDDDTTRETGVSSSGSLPITGTHSSAPIRVLRHPTTITWYKRLAWQRRKDGLCRIPLPALWPGQALGGDELSIVIVPMPGESLRGQLGQPGEQSPPRGCDLSAHHPDGPRDVPHDFHQNAAVLLSALMRCGCSAWTIL